MKQRLFLMLLLAIACVVISRQSSAKSNPLPVQERHACVVITRIVHAPCQCGSSQGQDSLRLEFSQACGTATWTTDLRNCNGNPFCTFASDSQVPCSNESCVTFFDNDHDGYGDRCCGGGDCEDTSPIINPGVASSCITGVDANCNGIDDSLDCACGNCSSGTDCSGCPNTFCDIDGILKCVNPSPILIDVEGDGFKLTSAAGGVSFDINGDGIKELLSWTTPGSDDAWLTLDRNSDGKITSGLELFGNFGPQPNPPQG